MLKIFDRNYRRIATVILFSFYSAAAGIFILFYFSFYSSFSGSSFYERYVGYGWILATSIPIFVYGVLDKVSSLVNFFALRRLRRHMLARASKPLHVVSTMIR